MAVITPSTGVPGIGVGGSFGIKVQINTGDMQSIQRSAGKVQQVVSRGLNTRMDAMLRDGVRFANRIAPHGENGNWARGDPPLSQSHQGTRLNQFMGWISSTAPHAEAIHEGFTPHVPPAQAWIGAPNLSRPARLKVLENQTPVAPRPWLPKVADEIDRVNKIAVQVMNDQVLNAWGKGLLGGAHAIGRP